MFSIILPVYNGGPYLNEAIESVLSQKFNTWELLIIIDGSTDNSREIATDYAARDSRIRVLQHPGGQNKGVSATRNLGILQAKGDWIAPLDSDDIWRPDKLEKELEIIKAYPSLVLIWSKAKIKYEYKRECRYYLYSDHS